MSSYCFSSIICARRGVEWRPGDKDYEIVKKISDKMKSGNLYKNKKGNLSFSEKNGVVRKRCDYGSVFVILETGDTFTLPTRKVTATFRNTISNLGLKIKKIKGNEFIYEFLVIGKREND